MNVLLAGQKWFGVEVLRALAGLPGVSTTAVCSPPGDALQRAATAAGLPLIPAGTLNAQTMPRGVDLIVAAHSHDFIGERTRLRARLGGIGYHPSLLPLHRGRDAVRWAVRLRERVTGGTVYRLSNRMDGGAVLEQRHVFIRPDDDAQSLWRRELGPLGVELLAAAVGRLAREGFVAGHEQDEDLATWEPALDRPPAFRPDLLMLGAPARPVYRRCGEPADDDTLEDMLRGGHAAYVVAHAKRVA